MIYIRKYHVLVFPDIFCSFFGCVQGVQTFVQETPPCVQTIVQETPPVSPFMILLIFCDINCDMEVKAPCRYWG